MDKHNKTETDSDTKNKPVVAREEGAGRSVTGEEIEVQACCHKLRHCDVAQCGGHGGGCSNACVTTGGSRSCTDDRSATPES